jgi:5-methylcytosine-specific restriction protein A
VLKTIVKILEKVYRSNISSDSITELNSIFSTTESIEITKPTITESLVEPDTPPETEFQEGNRMKKEMDFFVRNSKLVKLAKQHYNFTCQVCGFKFEDKYGQLGHNFIECHHLNPLSERDVRELENSFTTSLHDVTVLCSNCHSMTHRKKPPLTVSELRSLIDQSSTKYN